MGEPSSVVADFGEYAGTGELAQSRKAGDKPLSGCWRNAAGVSAS